MLVEEPEPLGAEPGPRAAVRLTQIGAEDADRTGAERLEPCNGAQEFAS